MVHSRLGSLVFPTATFSPAIRSQHGRSSGRRRVPVERRHSFASRSSMTVRRCLHGEAPRYLADLITPSAAATARAGLRSATSGYVAVSRTMSSLGDRSFAVAAPRSWNKLPSPLRRADSVNTFKRQLKTVLLPRLFSFLIFRFCILLGALVVFRTLTSP